MRQLRRHSHAAVAARRHGPLPVQRLRPLQQDERHEPAAEAAAAAGTSARSRAPPRRADPRRTHSPLTRAVPPPVRPPREIRARRRPGPRCLALTQLVLAVAVEGAPPPGADFFKGLLYNGLATPHAHAQSPAPLPVPPFTDYKQKKGVRVPHPLPSAADYPHPSRLLTLPASSNHSNA